MALRHHKFVDEAAVPIRAGASLAVAVSDAQPKRSPARELMELLERQVSVAEYPEPHIDKIAPAWSLLILVGGSTLTWSFVIFLGHLVFSTRS
ncbi:hypothetical protein [Caulobacter sp. S45]|uniref:hypothetical protein n=1 Tax=Caulobacter sp. S45 TaxID=1641861 RepID=UPI0015769ED7|nr:hypothetical protein [Caulobacter sp. S45]